MTTMFAEQIQQERIVAVKKRILRNLVDEAGNEIKETQLEVYRNYGVALNPLTKLCQQQPKISFWTAMIELFESNQAVPYCAWCISWQRSPPSAGWRPPSFPWRGGR